MKRSFTTGLLILTTVFLLTAFSGLAFAGGQWILTDKGAKVWGPTAPDVSVTWSGGVDADGYATGQGTL